MVNTMSGQLCHAGCAHTGALKCADLHVGFLFALLRDSSYEMTPSVLIETEFTRQKCCLRRVLTEHCGYPEGRNGDRGLQNRQFERYQWLQERIQRVFREGR